MSVTRQISVPGTERHLNGRSLSYSECHCWQEDVRRKNLSLHRRGRCISDYTAAKTPQEQVGRWRCVRILRTGGVIIPHHGRSSSRVKLRVSLPRIGGEVNCGRLVHRTISTMRFNAGLPYPRNRPRPQRKAPPLPSNQPSPMLPARRRG